MKTKFLKYILVLFIIALPVLIHCQTIVTTAGSPSVCPGDVIVPVTVTNFFDVGAISLVLEYDTVALSYMNYENVHTSLSGGMLVVNQTGNRIIISWASTTPANIGDGNLLDIHFTGVTGSSSIIWDTQTQGNCEYSDHDGDILLSTFTNGTSTVYQVPVITNQPQDIHALVNDDVTFSITAAATEISRLWYVSTNGGDDWSSTGVTSTTLHVNDVTLAMNGYLYRCEISGTCDPVVVSDAAQLYVIEPLTSTFGIDNTCPGLINVPILASNFTDVASFSLAFSFSSNLEFSGYQGINPLLSSNFVCNSVEDMIYLSWSNNVPVTFGNDSILVEILFNSTPGNTNLVWDLSTPGNCEYTYLDALPVTSVFVNKSFTVYDVPQVSSQPTDRLIPENTNTNFSITASGSGKTYQWQVSNNDGVDWNDLSNVGFYTGVTTATLNITNASLGLSGNWYRCVVSGYCSPSAISNPGELIVLPRITAIAGTLSDCPGTVIVPVDVTHFIDVSSFSLILDFNDAVLVYDSYQSLNSELNVGNFVINCVLDKVYMTWSSLTPVTIGDDLLIELQFTGVTGSSSMIWDNSIDGNCEFSDLEGHIIFDNYVNGDVTIYQVPMITGDPSNQIVPEGTAANFTITATGQGISYHWQENADGENWNTLSNAPPYSGVNSNHLQINPVSSSLDGYQYRCWVTGTCTPDVYSEPASLHVVPPVINTTAGSVNNSCTGNITIPVFVSNCNNIGAISLALNYDPAKLSFDGYQSVNVELNGGFLIVNATSTQVILSWASVDPAYIGSGTLIEYKFRAAAGISTTLSWDTQNSGMCEYSDPEGYIYVATFTSGTVSTITNALIVDAGPDETINAGESVQLNGAASGGSLPYNIQWLPTSWLNNPNIFDPLANPPVTTNYIITVTDDNGCVAWDEVMVEVTAAGFDLDLNAFFEGPFTGMEMSTQLNSLGLIPLVQPYSISPWNYGGNEYVTSIPNADIVDWVLIELRETDGGPSAAIPATMIAQKACFILKDGSIVDVDGANPLHFELVISDNLYALIHHRNHLSVMSSVPLSNIGGLYSWDFTTGEGQAYGTAALKNLGNGHYGLYAGDVDASGLIETADLNVWKLKAGETGYEGADFNFDSQLDNQDKNDFWYENLNEQRQIPE